MLKEMLKIDGAGAGSHSSQEAANSATYGGQQQNRRRSSKKLGMSLINASPASLLHAESTTEEVTCLYTPSAMFWFLPFNPFSPPTAANMNSPHGDSPASAAPANLSNAMLGSKVSELARVCVGLGMAPPDFSFIGNRQVTSTV